MGRSIGQVGALEPGRRAASRLVSIVATALMILGLSAQTAAAKGGGQIGEAWGSPGATSGKFFNPAMFGVDPGNGTVYSGDLSSDLSKYRIQQLSPTGEFKASVEIARFPEAEKIATMHGIAVDPVLERFYLLEGCRVNEISPACRKTGPRFSARQILVFSTKPVSGKLVPATPATLTLPTGTEQLYTPQSIAVDPSTHDLVVFAEDAARRPVVQRISSAGVAGARFVDTAKKLKPSGSETPVSGDATSIAVSSSGESYALTGSPIKAGAISTRAWHLPPSLTSVAEVPGFAAAALDENWALGLEGPFLDPLVGGPQLTIEGDTLYWKERLSPSSPTEAGDILVRGYSLTKSETVTLFGGGSPRCKITTSTAGIAATEGSKLVVFDYGPETKKATDTPAYGLKVVTFGPSGTDCPEPVAKFTVNGKTEEVTVKPGDTVTFDASSSKLLEGFRRELIWKFGDGSEETVKFTPGGEGEEDIPAKTTVTHQYAKAGKFTVTLRVKMDKAPFGNPAPAERTLTVEGSVPKFGLTVSKAGGGTGAVTSSPGGIDCGADCAENYDEGTKVTLTPAADAGSEFTGWSGACTGSGACEVTMSAAKSVTAQFDLQQHQLSVARSGSGTGTVTSSPPGIDCGATCSANFTHGTSVSLSASPGEGSTFTGWSGACSGSGACEVTMDAAKSVTAVFNEAGPIGGLYCTGNDISGTGSSLQAVAHQEVWGPAFPVGVCPGGADIDYEPTTSAEGMAEWNADGKKGSLNTFQSFIGTDEAPAAVQIASIKGVAGGARVVVIPVAQTSIAILANPPAGCEVEAITNSQLAALFEGKLSSWDKLDTAEGTCGSPITRVVRNDASGTTLQFKNYLYTLYKKGLFCTTGATEGKASWQELEPIGAGGAPNTTWPQTCGGKALSALVRPAENGGGAVADTVDATAGSIGYALLPDAQGGSATILQLQNNGQKKVSEATFGAAGVGSMANCSSMSYRVPAGGGHLDMDWSQVFGAQPAIGGGAYPLCMLTYALALHGYEAAGFSVGDERTVKDYLKGYVVQNVGQEAIAGNHYASLPSSPQERRDVLGAARKAAAKITR